MDWSDMDDRPVKKRKLSAASTFDVDPGYTEEPGADANTEENFPVFAFAHEFNLEIAIRQRLLQAAQYRIQWANILLESLKADENTGESSSGLSSSDYKNIALQTLNTIHTSIDSIVSCESPLESTQAFHSHRRDVKAAPHARPVYPPPAKPKVMYLCDEVSGSYVKMACTDCGRSDFTSLQGLLNHCRLSHKREYGGHDECMQHCAVPVPKEDVSWVVANGYQLSGVSLPSLGRLFKTAVGAELPEHKHVTTSTISDSIADSDLPNKAETPLSEKTSVSTHLTKTLGFHKNSPALAPFLGRVTKPRVIHCYDVDTPVDILTTPSSKKNNDRHWTMSFSKRSAPKQEFDIVLPPPASTADPSGSDVPNRPMFKAIEEQGGTYNQKGHSRFHIVSRIHIVDKSMWIPPNNRVPEAKNMTHRWVIAVSSPPYSIDATAVLKRMTVTVSSTFDSETASGIIIESSSITEAPLVATGLTKTAFLAHIKFEWADKEDGNENMGMNPPSEVDYWVDIVPIHATNTIAFATGDQQTLDIELDRNTILFPVRENDIEKRLTQLRMEVRATPQTQPTVKLNEDTESPNPYARLQNLLSKLPMTLRDARGRSVASIPYKLVTSPEALLKLNPGRRKAIEWGRAHALCQRYNQLRLSALEELQVMASDDQTCITASGDAALPQLSTADVYRWMESSACFPRPPSSLSQSSTSPVTNVGFRQERSQSAEAAEPSSAQQQQITFCATCGRTLGEHPRSQADGDSNAPFACPLVRLNDNIADVGWPIVDVRALLRADERAVAMPTGDHDDGLSSRIHIPKGCAPACGADLVAAVDPRLALAMRALVHARFGGSPAICAWPCVPPGFRKLSADVDGDNEVIPPAPPSRASIENALAPYAQLALLVRPLVRRLVSAGLDQMRRDDEGIIMLVMSETLRPVAADSDGDGERRAEPPLPRRSSDDADDSLRSLHASNEKRDVTRLLTPSHVLRGIKLDRQLALTFGTLALSEAGAFQGL